MMLAADSRAIIAQRWTYPIKSLDMSGDSYLESRPGLKSQFPGVQVQTKKRAIATVSSIRTDGR
jgi:hypothetical protein